MTPSRNGTARRAAPRYQQVADDLKKRIESGRYAVGGHLPTEMELCGRYRISRHTVREALRQLRDAGLISRRRRVGTEVVARTPRIGYRQPTNSIRDLLQYGEETTLTILRIKEIVCDGALAKTLEARVGARWLELTSLRTMPGDPRPVCLTTTHVDHRFPGIVEKLSQLTVPITAMLEREYDVRIGRVEQSIQAVRLTKRAAKLLRATEGAAALCAVRRYYDPRGRLLEMSAALHPGDRFTYVTTLVRS